MDSIEKSVFFIFFFALHALLAIQFWGISKSVLAYFWPKAKGEVIYAGIDTNYESDGNTYAPVVEYKYRVRGKEYCSRRFAYGYVASSFGFSASSIYKKYRNRLHVNVFYNPKRPSESVLLVGFRFFHLVNVVFLFGMLYIFIYRHSL